ncbi:MAG: sigma-70 family RNA polymerase sigma factor [Marinilabiliaceae bacterium]|nr:sigma-70 family RNA polymerase sigma factor [Marinilabiliaceae bacterium]
MTAIEFDFNLNKMRSHLRRFAYKLTLNNESAQDLVQDTFYKAWANREKFREDINFKAWTFTIMRNIFINEYRKLQKSRRIDQTPDHFTIVQKYKSDDTPDGRLSMIQLHEAMEKLEYEYKTPLLMHVQGFKYYEIAEKLNLKMGTVKSRIFLSRKKLSNLIGEHAVSQILL